MGGGKASVMAVVTAGGACVRNLNIRDVYDQGLGMDHDGRDVFAVRAGNKLSEAIYRGKATEKCSNESFHCG